MNAIDNETLMPEDAAPAPEVVTTGRRSFEELAREYWPVVALGLLAIATSLVARHMLFPAYSWNRDEPVYIWQVNTLRAGQFGTNDGGAPILFHPWLSAAKDGVFFSHFPIGWPLAMLAADVVLGSPDFALALGALLTVLGTYALARELTRDRSLALIAGAVMLACPILAIQGGVYLGYLFTLGLACCSPRRSSRACEGRSPGCSSWPVSWPDGSSSPDRSTPSCGRWPSPAIWCWFTGASGGGSCGPCPGWRWGWCRSPSPPSPTTTG